MGVNDMMASAVLALSERAQSPGHRKPCQDAAGDKNGDRLSIRSNASTMEGCQG